MQNTTEERPNRDSAQQRINELYANREPYSEADITDGYHCAFLEARHEVFLSQAAQDRQKAKEGGE